MDSRQGKPHVMKVKKLGHKEDRGQTEMPTLRTEAALGLGYSAWLSNF